MHNMFNENAEHGKFLPLFPSLLGSTSHLILNGGHYPQMIPDRSGEPARVNALISMSRFYKKNMGE